MKCTDVSTILDERRERRLTAAERCAVDEHLATCDDCACAWHAQATLLEVAVPPTPPCLLERALRARTTGTPTHRAALRVGVGVAVLAAGAALAAVISLTLSEHAAEQQASVPAPPQTATTPPSIPPAASAPVERPAAAAPADDTADAEPAWPLPDTDFVPLIREAPFYPPTALERKLEGWVKLEFTITNTGSVKDVVARDSSDALFEKPAIVALSQWKYLPRIVGGKPVKNAGVQAIIRFQLDQPTPPPVERVVTPSVAQNGLDYEQFSERIEPAWSCAADDDVRCAELVLDEIVATYELTPQQRAQIWDFYGHIYLRYGDTGRAIDAFEKAGSWLRVAHLYFEQHQYDLALQALRRSTEGKQPPWPRDTQTFIDRLRAIGVADGDF